MGAVIFNKPSGTQTVTAGGSAFNTLQNSGANISQLSDVTAAALTLDAGTTYTIGSNTVTINGAITGTGKFGGSSTSNMTLGGTAGTINMDVTSAATRSLNNLTLSGAGASAALGTAMDMYGNMKLNDGTLAVASKHLTLKSNPTNTATIDKLLASGSNLTGVDNVTAERFVKLRGTVNGTGTSNGGRAYRVVTPTVTTTTTINANWQNGEVNPAIGTYVNSANPGYGVQITGAGGNANGFDVTQTNQASLYTFTNGSNINNSISYPVVTNTNVNTLDAKKGYFLYIRGDRSTSTTVGYNAAGGMPTSSTTLTATGTVQKGAISFPISGANGDFSLVTNPYPAPLNWSLVYAANPNISTSYTMWDPNSGIEGGFVTVNSLGVPNQTSTANLFIQPGEAFFVQKNAVAGSTITLAESMKAVGSNDNGVFRMVTPFESFSAELFLTEANGVRHTADGVRVEYNNSYSTGADAADVDEINNWGENIAIARAGRRMGIEGRPVIATRDTIPLFINKMKQTGYEIEFTPSMFSNQSLKAELIDNFLHTRTLLSVINTTVVPFTVTADPASYATDRFTVVFGPMSALAIDQTTITAYKKNAGVQVEWVAKSETDMDHYEIERSLDGTQFGKQASQVAVGNSSVAVNYSWFDANPQTGNNFYRVKAIDKSGQIKYTSIVKVTIGKTDQVIGVYPNPINGSSFSLQLNDMDKGTYNVRLYNNLGQLVFKTQVLHSGGTATKTISLGNINGKGIYQLEVTGENNVKITQRIVKN